MHLVTHNSSQFCWCVVLSVFDCVCPIISRIRFLASYMLTPFLDPILVSSSPDDISSPECILKSSAVFLDCSSSGSCSISSCSSSLFDVRARLLISFSLLSGVLKDLLSLLLDRLLDPFSFRPPGAAFAIEITRRSELVLVWFTDSCSSSDLRLSPGGKGVVFGFSLCSLE